jgi:hypothetical protein
MLFVTVVLLAIVSYFSYFWRYLVVYLRNPRINGIPGFSQLYDYYKLKPEGNNFTQILSQHFLFQIFYKQILYATQLSSS